MLFADDVSWPGAVVAVASMFFAGFIMYLLLRDK